MLDELRSLGVVVWLNHEGQLAFDGPSDVLNDDLLARMKANKAGLLAEVRESNTRARAESQDGAFDNCPECGPSYQLEMVEAGLECPKCRELIWRFEGGSTIRADVESFDEVPLASVPQCFVCDRLCDRVNGLGLWYCSRCDPLAKTRACKTTDALKVKKRWGRD